jgi:ribosome biogenesis protein BRX1
LVGVFLFFFISQIWVRNYQILEQAPSNAKEAQDMKKKLSVAGGGGGGGSGGHGVVSTSLVEIGPRFVLNPIRIFRGSFGGQTLYRNPHYISPNTSRSLARKVKGQAYEQRKLSQSLRQKRKAEIVLPEDPLASVFD